MRRLTCLIGWMALTTALQGGVAGAAPPPGCRGAVLLGHDGRVGRKRFRVPTGKRRVVRVVLSHRGMSLVRRRARGPAGAFVRIDARVRDGRVSREAGSAGLVIDRMR